MPLSVETPAPPKNTMLLLLAMISSNACTCLLYTSNTIRPYAVVDLTAAKAGFRTVRIQGVQIFAGQVTLDVYKRQTSYSLFHVVRPTTPSLVRPK